MDYVIKTTTDNIDFNEVYDILSYYGLSHADAETQKKILKTAMRLFF